MSAYVYIIYSEKWNQFYVGSALDIEIRLTEHNSSRNTSTRGGNPWILKYTEAFENESLARSREYAIKKKKSRKYIEWLISSVG